MHQANGYQWNTDVLAFAAWHKPNTVQTDGYVARDGMLTTLHYINGVKLVFFPAKLPTVNFVNSG